MLLLFISICTLVAMGMLFLRLKRGYFSKGDVVTVPITMVFVGLTGVSVVVSLMGYILSVLSLFK